MLVFFFIKQGLPFLQALCAYKLQPQMIGALCNLALHCTQQTTTAFASSFALSDQAYCSSTGAVAVVVLVGHEQQ